MIADPYQVLGIRRGASADEVKRAYRELSKKYHPDSHMNNPLSDLAEERFKEIQLAYQQVMDDLDRGSNTGYYNAGTSGAYAGSSNYGGSGSSSGEASYRSEDNTMEMNNVYQLLLARRYQEAIRSLSSISDHSARWYYFSAVANNGLGNKVVAFDHARQAAVLDPSNRDYANLVNQLQFSTQRYQNTGVNYGRSNVGTGNFCCDLMCADAMCECMGGDLCGCF
ncbi:MAG: J domain-containing protein [Vallitaleaceae bacterium]|nr:J domain-containing protein [Vallitaleaceae bacterium]